MRDGFDLFCEGEFVVMRGCVKSFVVNVEEDDDDERCEEGGGGVDVLLVEDDVEIFGVLCEEYLGEG